MSLSALFLLALATTAAGQSSRSKPVVMPFGLSYGQHTFGAWFGIPVTVGSQEFELAISTSLSRSWVPGKALCDKDSNVTRCTAGFGGVYDSGQSTTWNADAAQASVKIEDELLKSFYNKTVGPQVMVQSGSSKKLLAMEGVGNVGTDTIILQSNTGAPKMASQTVGVITDGNKEFMANGYLSLQQMALSLYEGQFTSSPTFHLFQGEASGTNDSTLSLDEHDYGAYSLIFGGYNSMLDLNSTQQYPLVETNFATGASSVAPLAKDVALPASETVSYGMHVMLEDIVYRWTEGGGTDNSLVSKPTLAIIDSTTPWIWLPKSTLSSFLQISGAVWNDTYASYTLPWCSSDGCSATQQRALDALLDFKFELMNGDKLTLDVYNYFLVRYLPSNDTIVYMVPFRELPEDGPIVLGRPFLAGIHLWVDYAEKYWGMAQGNVTLQHDTLSQVIPWDRDSHPPITNSSILVQRPSGTSLSDSSGTATPGGTPGTPGAKSLSTGALAGIAAGGGAVLICLAIAGVCLFRRRRRNAANRPESMIELHPRNDHKAAELPNDVQFRPHELPPNHAPNKLHELPQGQVGGKAYQELQGSAHYQGQNQYPPPSPHGMYPPPPMYDGAQGGPVYYEMDGGQGGH